MRTLALVGAGRGLGAAVARCGISGLVAGEEVVGRLGSGGGRGGS